VPVEVMGIDHVFIVVRNLRVSEGFYDRVMDVLGFRKCHLLQPPLRVRAEAREGVHPRPRPLRARVAPLLL
jgi:hypothetical protein